jgi:diguanylate cyclase (GGDEF)-like protein/PAS domain S-box-containing protein
VPRVSRGAERRKRALVRGFGSGTLGRGASAGIGVLSDITERRERESKAKEATAIIEAAGEGIVVSGSDGRIHSVNPAFTTSTGFALKEIVGQPWDRLQARRSGDAPWEQIEEKAYAGDGRWQGEIALRRKDGSVFEALESLTFVIDPETGARHYISIIADIGVLRRTQERLRALAHHDPLTGLPNRLLFQERLEHALARNKRRGQMCAVLFIDLDDFKRVNDILGYGAGDRLLQNVAGRIAGALRDEDTVARFGGDEFVVLIEGIATVQHGAAVCEKILETLAPALDIDGHLIAARASIGVAVFPENGETPDRLIEAADTALYRMKAGGRGHYCLYHPEMSARIAERVLLADSLRRALGKGDLRLFFQPQVSLLDGRVSGFGALVRWQHADLGCYYPRASSPSPRTRGLSCPWDIGLRSRPAQRRMPGLRPGGPRGSRSIARPASLRRRIIWTGCRRC